MRHTQSLLAEMRALEEKRAGAGLTPDEEGRLAELRALGGAARAARGFDVNAAAAVIREEIVSATPPPVDVGALGPRTPPAPDAVSPGALGLPEAPPAADPDAGAGRPFSGPPPEADLFPPEGFEVAAPGPGAPEGPLQAQGYDEIPAFDAARAFALDAGDPNETSRWDPAALAAQGFDPSPEPPDQAGWEADTPAAGPDAPQAYDPSLYPQDSNAAWDPNAQPQDPGALPYDPNAPQAYDPSLYPQDPNAAWDPNAQPYDPGALPYDPNAPQAYDPSLYPQDPSAQPYDDPSALPYDPNAPQAYDPSLYPQDPNAQPYDPSALPYDPNAPQAYDPGLTADPLASEPAPDPAAEWSLPGSTAPAASAAPAEAAAAPDVDTASWDLGRVPPAPSEETGSYALGPGEDFRHEPPAGWTGEVGEELLDQLEPVSSGSFPPIDLSVLPDAQVELPPVPPEPELPLAPAPEEPAPLTDVYALAEQAAAARSPFDFELPPVTPAEEAILEVGADVQEVETDDLAGAEPVELVEEVTRPVPEFADPLDSEPPTLAPPPAAPPPPPVAHPVQLADEPEPRAPRAAEPEVPAPRRDPVTLALDASVLDGATFEPPPPEGWEPDITVEEPPAPPPPAPEPVPEPPRAAIPPPPLFTPAPEPVPPPPAAAPPVEEPPVSPALVAAAFAEPPVRPPAPSLPPLVSAFAPPGEPVSLDTIGIEEAPPEPEPAPDAPRPLAPPPPAQAAAAPAGARQLEGIFRVVLHTVEGQVKRGTLQDPVLDGGELLLEGPGGAEHLPGDRIRAIFFMLGSGEQAPDPWGRRVRVTFRDGRQVAGFSPDYDPGAVGFFMVPADTRTNTARIWVYRSAVRQVSVSD